MLFDTPRVRRVSTDKHPVVLWRSYPRPVRKVNQKHPLWLVLVWTGGKKTHKYHRSSIFSPPLRLDKQLVRHLQPTTTAGFGQRNSKFFFLPSKPLKQMIHLACKRNRGAVGSLRQQTDARMTGDLVIFILSAITVTSMEMSLCCWGLFLLLAFLTDAAKMAAKQIYVKFLPTYTHRHRPTLTDSPPAPWISL